MTDLERYGGSASDPRPVVFVLFGATGDLARRMVLPAFYQLVREGLADLQTPIPWRDGRTLRFRFPPR